MWFDVSAVGEHFFFSLQAERMLVRGPACLVRSVCLAFVSRDDVVVTTVV